MSTQYSTSATRVSSLVLLAMLIAACGSATISPAASGAGSTASAGGGSAATAAAQGQQGGAGSVEDGLGHPVNVCTLLPASTAASISGEPITKATEDDTTSYKIYACDYSNDAGTTGFRISVLALDAAAGYDGSLAANGTGAKQVSGLGDKAFSAITGVEALFGNVSITVSNLASDAASEALIRALQPKL